MATIDVVVRCRNEMPYARKVFQALKRPEFRVWVFDSGSTDGSREQAVEAGYEIVDIAPEKYVPGRVLNQAMEVTSSAVVAFVNADAIPLSDDAVHKLVDACQRGAAACYGKQVPRPNARADTRRDYERAFPDSPRGPGFGHFFSMAASAIRRDVWERLPFDPGLQYSEDVDWTWRLKALGLTVAYVPQARFEHSHDYPPRALLRRMRGEGQADALIYHLPPPGLVRDMLRPLVGASVRDWRSGLLRPDILHRRVVAQVGRFRGRLEGETALRVVRRSDRVRSLGPDTRLTANGDERAEQVVRNALNIAVKVTRQHLAGQYLALVLVGGYAGGEGAVDRLPDGQPAIHNDLDLVLVVDGAWKARGMRQACEQISKEASDRVGASVDLYPVDVAELRNGRGKLIWVDAALRGVLVVDGDERVLEPLRRLGPRHVDADELGRLLVNRATGIALSRLAFAAGENEGERAARHRAKMWIALGDALLVQVARYEGGLRRRLQELAWLAPIGGPFVESIHAGYREALEYRADPKSVSLDRDGLEAELASMWEALRQLEAHRLGERPWASVHDYVGRSRPLFPHKRDIPRLARYLAGARAAARGVVPWSRSFDHPREWLARVAVRLAFSPDFEEARDAVARWLAVSPRPASLVTSLESLREVGS